MWRVRLIVSITWFSLYIIVCALAHDFITRPYLSSKPCFVRDVLWRGVAGATTPLSRATTDADIREKRIIQAGKERQGRINYRNDRLTTRIAVTAPDTGNIARGDSARRKKRLQQRGSGLNGDCFSAGARSDWLADGAAGVGRVPSCGSRYYRGHLLVSSAVYGPTARAIEKDACRLRQITSKDHIDDAIARRLNMWFSVASLTVTARRCRVPR